MPEPRLRVRCGKEIVGRNKQATYCSIKCNQSVHKEKVKKPNTSMLKVVTGEYHELKACVALMECGWEVFRNMARHGATDMIVKKDGIITEIDVSTGTQYNGGDGIKYNVNRKKAQEPGVFILHCISGTGVILCQRPK